MLPEYDFQVLKLTQEFYNKYTNPPYVEIETKENRRYNCLLIQTHYDYFICVPFRSRVNHKYAYHFTKSERSKRGKSALDYSKIVIINTTDYIDKERLTLLQEHHKVTQSRLLLIYHVLFRVLRMLQIMLYRF